MDLWTWSKGVKPPQNQLGLGEGKILLFHGRLRPMLTIGPDHV
jgi:hypothetical protein